MLYAYNAAISSPQFCVTFTILKSFVNLFGIIFFYVLFEILHKQLLILFGFQISLTQTTFQFCHINQNFRSAVHIIIRHNCHTKREVVCSVTSFFSTHTHNVISLGKTHRYYISQNDIKVYLFVKIFNYRFSFFQLLRLIPLVRVFIVIKLKPCVNICLKSFIRLAE